MNTDMTPRELSPIMKASLEFVRHTPLSRGKARKIILNMIAARVKHPIKTYVRGVPFTLNLDNTTEQKALFACYNLEEIDFLLKGSSKPDAVFVDIGANSGFYTQNFLARNKGKAIAIEPNPAMCERIKTNYAMLADPSNRLTIENVAVGDAGAGGFLDVSSGVGGANIVNEANSNTIRVSMEPLTSILARNNISQIDVLKIDVEGYEDRALIPFFLSAPVTLYPRHIIIEHTSSTGWASDLFAVLKERGYTEAGKTRGNLLLTRA